MSTSGPQILVVDDDALLRELIATHLEQAGYRILQARDGIEALGALRDHKPDAMVLDLAMPRLDGVGLLTRMARLGDRTPTLVLTTRTNLDDVRGAMALGAKEYLAKPFEGHVLVGRLARMIPIGPAGDV
jgi:two-component system OmpR family response regulator